MPDKKKLTRRDFTQKSTLVIAGGVGCLALGGVKEALAQAKATGRPLLSEKALNQFLQKNVKDQAKYQQLCQEAGTNLHTFLQKYFTLTDAQDFAIRNLSTKSILQANEAITFAKDNVTPLQIKFVGQPSKLRVSGQITASVGAHAGGAGSTGGGTPPGGSSGATGGASVEASVSVSY